MRGLSFASMALAISSISAHPHSQHSKSLSKRTVDLNAFRLNIASDYTDSASVGTNSTLVGTNSTLVGTNSTVSSGLTKRATTEDTATNLVKKTVPAATIRLVESYTGTNSMAHFYYKQTANDIDIDNADFNVNIGKDGSVFSFGNSFFTGAIPPASDLEQQKITPEVALKNAITTLELPVDGNQATSQPKDGKQIFSLKNTNGALEEPEARLVYLVTSEGKLALTWRIEIDIQINWLLIYVDAKSGEKVYGVVDYGADASYQVYPWGINDPTEGERVVLQDPWTTASEFGWHSTGTEKFDTTRGNNGIAQINPKNTTEYLNNPRPTQPDLKFEYPLSLSEADPLKYQNASITQLFYTANSYHDLLHSLGFDEKAGNFEINNNGAGGKGDDFVILNSQDGYGKNNAKFFSPPDGMPGRMLMFLWNLTKPERDCSFEAGVVIHEYTHGLSNRLTGGPANSACLNGVESGGMGEGWSDFYATAIRLKPKDTRAVNYPMGAWIMGNPNGIRKYLYSTDMAVNPHVYTDVNALSQLVPKQVHPIGTVWASMLYEVLWNLIDKHGKNDKQFPEFDSKGVPKDGKYLAMKIVLEGMRLQPCNPDFVSARDSIIDADRDLTGGQNKCEIWKGFAKRGLGANAKYHDKERIGSFDIPQGVC